MNPSDQLMKHRKLAASLTLLAAITACRQMPTGESVSSTDGARYVEATALTSGSEYADAQVVTAVALQHVSAADAEARLQGKLPEGVRVARSGESNQLLIQGSGKAVTESIKVLAKIDVR
jgi:hypothetical protein